MQWEQLATGASHCVQVYAPEAMEPLLKCIQAVSSPSSTIVFAKYKRFAPATKVFWELLPEYFEFEKIPEADYGSPAQEDVIGLFRLTHTASNALAPSS